jgi:hypothetical protein
MSRKHSCISGWLGIVLGAVLIISGCGGGGGGSNGNGGTTTPNPTPASLFEIESVYFQYRTLEDSNSNSYRAWIGITKSGAPIQETDVDEIVVTDSAGNILTPASYGFYQNAYLSYDCVAGTCTASGPFEDSGFWAVFGDLPADTYQIEVITVDGETVTTNVGYAGQLALPVVASATMQSQWSNGDLVLRWTNPTGAANWTEVTQLRINVLDSSGKEVFYINTDPLNETVTIPAALVSQASNLGNGALARWQVQTRAIDANGMNYARGNSNTIGLSFAISSSYLQYRNYENPANNRYTAWIGVAKDGEPAQSTDVLGFTITGSANNPVTPVSSSFFRSTPNYYYYNCSTTPCSTTAVIDSGFSARYDNLSADEYQIEVDAADGQKFAATVTYTGQLVLPFVASTTMQSQWSNSDMVLSWTNPTSDPTWSEVDQLRIIILAADNTEILYIRPPAGAQSIIVPAALVSQAGELGHGAPARWQIQTRAIDANGMNFARGFSNTIGLSFAISSSYLQYRNYENPANNRYAAWIGVAKDGEPAQSTDVLGFTITGSAGNPVTPVSPSFYRSQPYYFYNCATTPCTTTANIIDSGFTARIDNLLADEYQIEVDAADGQKFATGVTYAGQLVLPFVSSATMQANWSNTPLLTGDLALSWTNPTGDPNWANVDQLRIVIVAADSTEVLYIRPAAGVNTVTIPEPLVNQAQALGHGLLDKWTIQTRSLDDNGMNDARGFSSTIDLPE